VPLFRHPTYRFVQTIQRNRHQKVVERVELESRNGMFVGLGKEDHRWNFTTRPCPQERESARRREIHVQKQDVQSGFAMCGNDFIGVSAPAQNTDCGMLPDVLDDAIAFSSIRHGNENVEISGLVHDSLCNGKVRTSPEKIDAHPIST
jgi:hypothetical protein